MGQQNAKLISKKKFTDELETISVSSFQYELKKNSLLAGFFRNDSIDCLVICGDMSSKVNDLQYNIEFHKNSLQFYRIIQNYPLPLSLTIVKRNEITEKIKEIFWETNVFDYYTNDSYNILTTVLDNFLEHEKFASTFEIDNVDVTDYAKVDSVLKICKAKHTIEFDIESHVTKGSLMKVTIKKRNIDQSEKSEKQYISKDSF